jgi:hypothetical protein
MAKGWRTAFAGTCLVGLSATALQGAPSGSGLAGLGQAESRLRTVERHSYALLSEALRCSSTVQDLAAKIEHSDLLIFLDISPEPGVWRGATNLMSVGTSPRVLRVKVNARLELTERIAVLGHELQHAWEVAAEPDVKDTLAMRRLLERIGFRISPSDDHYETHAAQQIERAVRDEVRRVRVVVLNWHGEPLPRRASR